MLDTNDYELLKENFIASQILFSKLRAVVYNILNIEYDGVGFYKDDEAIHERHKEKLRSKILESLCASLKSYQIKMLDQKEVAYDITFEFTLDRAISLLRVDFTQEGALDILQLS
ncbi:MAG: hypothetical protein PHU40_01975 [Sulfurimonas sp.]|nr:hypothetical protein [Sulfurimonas sp.]